MTRKITDLIEDMRNTVKPYIAKQLKQLNFENCGSTDKAEFETEFEMVLTLAEMANNQWIPCSEKMPEENGEYLVTVKRGYVTTALWVGNAEFWSEVTAWMPLPSIYQPKDGEK